LIGDVSALAAERPDAVPRVVVRHGNEERNRRGEEVVPLRAEHERAEHREVDHVARGADRAELRELNPVVRAA